MQHSTANCRRSEPENQPHATARRLGLAIARLTFQRIASNQSNRSLTVLV
jgi:hypothetical protein